MGVTVYSVIISVLFYNLSLIAVFLLRRSGAIRAKYMSSLLLFLTLLGAIRLLTPIDFDHAYIIHSYKVLPVIEDALTAPLLGSLSLGKILLLIWAAGIVAFVLRDLLRQRRYYQTEKRLLLTEKEQVICVAAEFGKGFKIKMSPEIDLPYVSGLFRPVIHLPDVELSDEEWRNIFRHETQHIRAGDEWKKLLFRAIRALFWWNPLVHVSEEDLNLLIELQCDKCVAGHGNLDEQESYLRTMMELMKRYVEAETPIVASRLIGKQEEMKIRFEALLSRETRRSKWMRRVVPVLLGAVFAASYFVIIQPARFPSDEEITSYHDEIWVKDVSTDFEKESEMFILYKNGEYELFIGGEYVASIDEELLDDPKFNTIPIYGGEK